jgi:hypothetical protein
MTRPIPYVYINDHDRIQAMTQWLDQRTKFHTYYVREPGPTKRIVLGFFIKDPKIAVMSILKFSPYVTYEHGKVLATLDWKVKYDKA